MKLTRLEIFGFKSFPQRTDIHFKDGITGIVGPNGSGKSNIADAVRWVLGEQSARALRGARMEDVIFAGTQKRKRLPYCEVSLTFDNQSGWLKSKHSEVMVSRRVYRSGEGEYAMNKAPCRLRDIIELFHDTGVGREGYSIIGQGHIDLILSGRGEERRAAFEDAAGIMGYRSRKEEAERKLVRTLDNLNRVGDLIAELGQRLDPLLEQSEKARVYLSLADRLKSLDANIFLERSARLSKRMDALKETLKTVSDQITSHENDIQAYQGQRHALDQSMERYRAQDEQLAQALRLAEEAYNAQQLKAEQAALVLENAQQESQRTRDAIKELQEEAALIQRSMEDASTSGQQQTAQKEAAEAVLHGLELAFTQAQEALSASEAALEAHRAGMLHSANTRSEKREQRARQEAMLAQADQRLTELENNREALQVEVQQAFSAKQAAQERLEATSNAVALMQTELQGLQGQLDAAQSAVVERAEALKAHQTRQQGISSRLSALKELSRMHEGYSQPVKQALRYAQGNPRVHGTVAQLIQVPKAYETAVEMVLGGSLQHIITQDEQTAKSLIEYLFEKRLGRTTFLPLSAVSGRSLNSQERQALHQKGCLGIASELMVLDPVYQGVVQSLLGRVVIAQDLDAAIAISRAGRQAFHVVTLDGQVMRAGGAMTGGSVQARTVSLLGREREIIELDEQLSAMAARAKELEGLGARAVDAANHLKDQVAKQREVVQNEEIGIAREEERFKRAEDGWKQAQSRQDQALAAIEQLSQMAQELQTDLSLAMAFTHQADKDLKEMEEQEAALRTSYQDDRQALEARRSQVEQQREVLAALMHRLDLSQRDQSRLTKEAATIQSREARLLENRRVQEQKILSTGQLLEELRQQELAQKQAVEASRAEAASFAAQQRDAQARLKTLMDSMEASYARHSEDSQRLHRGQLSLARLEEELQGITKHLWNTYELSHALALAFKFSEPLTLPNAEREAEDLRRQIKDLGAINIHALDEYAATKARFDDLSSQRDDANQARDDLLQLIKRLQEQMEKQFIREFSQLNEYFSETFKRLFRGGQASLVLADPSQPLDCEIQIHAQPPGKKLQLLSLLSGGERALTAIAILFAMLKLRPTPFCVLDEIEAALDDANIHSFADYLAEYVDQTQFIVITHRKGTMERCNALYGVTMKEKGVSDIISVNLQDYTA